MKLYLGICGVAKIEISFGLNPNFIPSLIFDQKLANFRENLPNT